VTSQGTAVFKIRERFLSGYTLRVVCIEQLSEKYVVIAMTRVDMRNETNCHKQGEEVP